VRERDGRGELECWTDAGPTRNSGWARGRGPSPRAASSARRHASEPRRSPPPHHPAPSAFPWSSPVHPGAHYAGGGRRRGALSSAQLPPPPGSRSSFGTSRGAHDVPPRLLTWREHRFVGLSPQKKDIQCEGKTTGSRFSSTAQISTNRQQPPGRCYHAPRQNEHQVTKPPCTRSRTGRGRGLWSVWISPARSRTAWPTSCS
jgi:hypothetical protein